MTSRAGVRLAAAASVVVATVVSAGTGCSTPQPRPFDPLALQQLERDAASQTRFRRLPPLVDETFDRRRFDANAETRREIGRGATADFGEVRPAADLADADPPTLAERPAVTLPLREVIRRATLNNFDVAVAGYEPGVAETRVIEALARFDPIFGVTVEAQNLEQQTAGQSFFDTQNNLVTVDTDRQRILTFSPFVRQLLPSGGEARLSYNTRRTDVTPRRFDINPAYESDLTLQFTQPLLRDFGRDINRARIVINQNDQRISVLDFRNRLEEVLLQIEQTYWQLYRSQQEVEIQRNLLDLTIRTADRIERRTLREASRDQITQAMARVNTRRAELIRAESAAAQLSDQLKRLMNDPDLPVASDVVVRAGDVPVAEPLLFDLEDAVVEALVNRPQLAQQVLRVESARTAQRVAESNRLPQLDAIASAGIQGVADSYDEAVRNQANFDGTSAAIGLRLEVPLGNRTARAVLRRSKLQTEQAFTQYQALIAQVTLEVKQAQRQVGTNFAVLGELRRGRLAAQDTVETFEVLEREEQPLTPEFSDRKLRAIDELAAAQRNELAAVTDYNISLAEYQRAKGTLLRYNNVVLDEAVRRTRLPVSAQDTRGPR